MPTLYLMRHAQAEGDSLSGLDVDRKLSSHGHSQARRMAQWLNQQPVHPEQIIASPAQRTRQTALAAAKALDIGANEIHWEARIYSATAGALLELLEPFFASHHSMLLVGHNPGLEILVRSLAPNVADLGAGQHILGMSPASIARIEWPEAPPGTAPREHFNLQAQLIQVIHPHQLSDEDD